jgi:hypothetical protein
MRRINTPKTEADQQEETEKTEPSDLYLQPGGTFIRADCKKASPISPFAPVQTKLGVRIENLFLTTKRYD